MKIYLILSIFLLSFFSCSNNLDSKKLIGKYFINNGSNQSITIIDNHTYKQLFYIENGQVFENKGTWRYDSRTEQISFDYFVLRSGLPAGTWVSRVKVTSDGEIRFIYSAEDDIYYFKK